jgi:hypothetical protein
MGRDKRFVRRSEKATAPRTSGSSPLTETRRPGVLAMVGLIESAACGPWRVQIVITRVVVRLVVALIRVKADLDETNYVFECVDC